MTLAEAHHWLPSQVDRLDPDFVDELLIQKMARNDHDLLSVDAKDNTELKKRQADRRRDLMDWRKGV